MVRCETRESSVGATLSDSMLYPREENNEVTRVSAPASFCSKIEIMCRMKFPVHGNQAAAPRLDEFGGNGVPERPLLQCRGNSKTLCEPLETEKSGWRHGLSTRGVFE
jgi:hypothetical protein